MKVLLYILSITTILFASTHDTAACKKCHPLIAQEFENSMHKKSSIYDDKIHKAVWDKHPASAKGNYKCAKCHTPNAKEAKAQKEGISCISCHTISNVEKHAQSNKNIYSGEKKKFYSAEIGRENEKVIYKKESSLFGMNVTTTGSAYHDLDYTNENFYNANVCMGCHSHKQNSHEFSVCTTEEEGAKDKKTNCITCHMPKVDGSATTVRISKQHSFHGFAGAHTKPQMLKKYVEFGFEKNSNGFEIIVHNKAPHNLMTHPLRLVQLRVNHIRDAKSTALKTQTFVKVIGTEGKPSMPWLATEVVKDTMIKANEKRKVKYDKKLKSGDTVEVILGYYIVNPKAVEKLNLQDDKAATEFKILKSQNINIE